MFAKFVLHSRFLQWLWPEDFSPKFCAEQGQAWVRFWALCAFLLILGLLGIAGQPTRAVEVVALVFLVYAYVWIWVTGLWMFNESQRLACSLVIDNVLIGAGFYFGGEVYSLALWSPFFAAIGHGLRFGRRQAIYFVVVSVICVGIALERSPFWHAHAMVSMGVVMSMVIVPVLTVTLSEELARAKRAFEKKAADLEVTSRMDPLTGLLNRRGLINCLSRHLNDLRRSRLRSALIYIDLDGFKEVNDSAGHALGDAVLQSVASSVIDCLGPSDQASRIGGDEYVALLKTVVREADAREVAQRILTQIQAISVLGYEELRIGASIGICLLPDLHARDAESVLGVADQMMYEAKRAGKNRIRILNPDPPEDDVIVCER